MKLLLVFLITNLIFACSDNNTSDTPNSEASKPTNLLNTQMDALEKSKELEESLQKMTEQREEEMSQQGI